MNLKVDFDAKVQYNLGEKQICDIESCETVNKDGIPQLNQIASTQQIHQAVNIKMTSSSSLKSNSFTKNLSKVDFIFDVKQQKKRKILTQMILSLLLLFFGASVIIPYFVKNHKKLRHQTLFKKICVIYFSVLGISINNSLIWIEMYMLYNLDYYEEYRQLIIINFIYICILYIYIAFICDKNFKQIKFYLICFDDHQRENTTKQLEKLLNKYFINPENLQIQFFDFRIDDCSSKFKNSIKKLFQVNNSNSQNQINSVQFMIKLINYINNQQGKLLTTEALVFAIVQGLVIIKGIIPCFNRLYHGQSFYGSNVFATVVIFLFQSIVYGFIQKIMISCSDLFILQNYIKIISDRFKYKQYLNKNQFNFPSLDPTIVQNLFAWNAIRKLGYFFLKQQSTSVDIGNTILIVYQLIALCLWILHNIIRFKYNENFFDDLNIQFFLLIDCVSIFFSSQYRLLNQVRCNKEIEKQINRLKKLKEILNVLLFISNGYFQMQDYKLQQQSLSLSQNSVQNFYENLSIKVKKQAIQLNQTQSQVLQTLIDNLKTVIQDCEFDYQSKPIKYLHIKKATYQLFSGIWTGVGTIIYSSIQFSLKQRQNIQ